MSKKRKQLTLGDFYKKTPKQTEKEDQPSVAGGSTSDVGTTTKPREEAANVSSNINLTTNVNVTVGAKETEQDEPRAKKIAIVVEAKEMRKRMMMLMITPMALLLPSRLLPEIGDAKLRGWSRLAGPANSGMSGPNAYHGYSPRMDV